MLKPTQQLAKHYENGQKYWGSHEKITNYASITLGCTYQYKQMPS
jgi:hypothetical protein